MLVLHGTWLGDTFYLWGEHYRPEIRRRGRRAQARPDRALKHPYAAERDILQRSLERIAGPEVPSGEDAVLHILLPSDAHSPAPSRELGNSPLGPVVPDRLGLWTVPALAWKPHQALDVLLSIPLHLIGPRPGLLLGTDVRYWAHVAYFLLNIIAGQHYIPYAERKGRHLRSVWQPWLGSSSLWEQFAALVKSMPPVCRAARPPRGSWTEPSARELLNQVLTVWLDRVLREWAAEVREETTTFPPLPALRWVQAR